MSIMCGKDSLIIPIASSFSPALCVLPTTMGLRTSFFSTDVTT